MATNNMFLERFQVFRVRLIERENQQVYKELGRRKKSKKARRRLVTSIMKRRGPSNGAFAREVIRVLGTTTVARLAVAYIADKIEQRGMSRECFPVRYVGPEVVSVEE